jgi:hypothetical protein
VAIVLDRGMFDIVSGSRDIPCVTVLSCTCLLVVSVSGRRSVRVILSIRRRRADMWDA